MCVTAPPRSGGKLTEVGGRTATAAGWVAIGGPSAYRDVMDAEPDTSTERAALTTFLDRQRDSLIRKVSPVSDADSRRVPTASSLSLLGLLKHAAIWKDRWFQGVVAGRPLPDGWPDPTTALPGEHLRVGDEDTVVQWVASYRAASARSQRIVEARDLDAQCVRTDLADCNLRFVILHLIEETARHAGHADIIRETLDGSTGV